MPPKNQTQRIDELLGGVTEELLLGNPQQFEDNSIRVERLLLEMVRPDPVQPRRVLPEPLHFAFHSSRLTPTQRHSSSWSNWCRSLPASADDLSTMFWNCSLIPTMKVMKTHPFISHRKNNCCVI